MYNKAFFLFEKEDCLAWQLSHVVDNRWNPILMRIGAFFIMSSSLLFFKGISNLGNLFYSLIPLTLIFLFWLRDVRREGSLQGAHSSLVQRGLKWALVWFLFREVWFFFSIFWRFFHFRTAPLTGGNSSWPLVVLEVVPPFQVPLLNTVILLIRGVTATLAHQDVLRGKSTTWVLIRSLLGVYFISLQGMEYYSRRISISSGVFGRIFFFGTGFHGFHVFLGLRILLISHFRLLKRSLSGWHHFGLEFSLWYWHFVDVVWLFLFCFVYAWGS